MPIDPTKPADGVPASKSELRANLQAALDGIGGGGGSANTNTSITINAASFGDSMDYFLICTATSAVAVTLAADVPTKKTLHVLAKHATADVTVDDNGSTSNLLTGLIATTAQYDSLVFRSLGSGEWVRVQTA
jgi:hypothetical protein